jgi:hypothetical protein
LIARLSVLIGVAASVVAPLVAQSVTIDTTGGVVRVRSGFSFIDGEVLDQLRDGRSVRTDLELTVLSEPRGRVLAAAKQSFNLSFDLWEERLAVTRLGSPARSVSHLRPRDAETWCLQGVSIAHADLTKLGADTPFWIRLVVQVPDLGITDDAGTDDVFTIRRLIDVFSRRSRDGDLVKVAEAGPFRLSRR